MSKWNVKFERVGRDHYVPDVCVEGDDADEIAYRIYGYVRPRLASSEVNVVANLEEGRGMIYCGFHNGGTFTLEAVA